MAFLLPNDPTLAPLKSVRLSSTPTWKYTPLKTPIGIASVFPPGQQPPELSLPRTTVPEAAVPMPEAAQNYIHWLLALHDSQLGRIEGVFGGALSASLDFFTSNWKLFVEDVKYGTLTGNNSEVFEIPNQVREKLKPILRPNPSRARQIEKQFKRGYKGICKRLWPRITFCHVLITGPHQVFKDQIQYFLGDDVKILSTAYGASELGCGAFNLDHPYIDIGYKRPKSDQQLFTFLPANGVFFEFIELDAEEDDDDFTLLLHQLEVGKRYEVVLTSDYCGFYRYRLGDIVQIVGHYNQSPIFEFCARMGSMLDVRGEKTSEDMVFNALLNFTREKIKPTGCKLIDFTSTDCVSYRKVVENADKGLFYIIFVEIDGIERALTSEEIEMFDQCLRATAQRVDALRSSGIFQMPQLFTVAKGSFEKFKQWTLDKTGGVSNQYKTSKYLKNEEAIDFMLKCKF